MVIPFWLEVAVGVVFLITIIADFAISERRLHVFTTKEAAVWTGVYIGLAAVLAGVIWGIGDHKDAIEFVSVFLTEKSLSVDNLFVFLVIMGSFAVPKELQHRVLFVGVLIALVLRAILIIGGVALVTSFQWIFLLFGLLLMWTAWKIVKDHGQEPQEIREKGIVKFVSRFFPAHDQYVGHKLLVKIDGRRHLTPMALVMLAIGGTDIMFALDSIPAAIGLSDDMFIIVTSNAFALMGLRQLYFLLDGLISRLVHLSKGMSVILAFIGIKLLLMGADAVLPMDVPHIPTELSLAVIVLVLAVTAYTSLKVAPDKPGAAGKSDSEESSNG